MKKKLIEKKGTEIHILVLKLAKSVPLHTIIYEIIKDYGFTAAQVTEVEKLLLSESGKYITSATHRILKNRNRLIIDTGNSGADNAHYIIDESTEKVLFGGGELNISRTIKPAEFNTNNDTACFDVAAFKYPLLLRRWKTGDYFYPLGIQKKKKLSRFFADIKLSLSQKEKIWVLESDKKILWVVGCRIDDRFKITAKTKDILKLHLTPAVP